MARVNVYLPDDLAADVKAAELSVSTICQQALTRELRMLQATKDVTFDPEQAAARLKQSEDAAFQEGRAVGIRWATDVAPHREEVTAVADLQPNVKFYDTSHSLFRYLAQADHRSAYSRDRDPADHENDEQWYVALEDTPFARGVIAGVAEVWKAIEPLL